MTSALIPSMLPAGALAVHCKAGLGRTGVLICCYLIKHHGFSAEEAIGYIRVCRPGSVIGPQQSFLLANAPRLAREGKLARASGKNPSLGLLPGWRCGDGGADLAKPCAGFGAALARSVFSVTADSSAAAPPAPAPPPAADPSSQPRKPRAPEQPAGARAAAAPSSATPCADPVAGAAVPAGAAATAAANAVGGAVPSGAPLRAFPELPPSGLAPGSGLPLLQRRSSGLHAAALQTLGRLASQGRAGAGAGAGKGPGHAVAHALAPNGQPRKLPAALLASPADLAEYAAASGEEGLGLALNPVAPRTGLGAAAGWTIGATMRSLASVRR